MRVPLLVAPNEAVLKGVLLKGVALKGLALEEVLLEEEELEELVGKLSLKPPPAFKTT